MQAALRSGHRWSHHIPPLGAARPPRARARGQAAACAGDAVHACPPIAWAVAEAWPMLLGSNLLRKGHGL